MFHFVDRVALPHSPTLKPLKPEAVAKKLAQLSEHPAREASG